MQSLKKMEPSYQERRKLEKRESPMKVCTCLFEIKWLYVIYIRYSFDVFDTLSLAAKPKPSKKHVTSTSDTAPSAPAGGASFGIMI